MSHEDTCHCCSHASSVQQTLHEMDFERGIWSAALDGDMDRIRSLLNKGCNVNSLDSSGYTALHYACRYGHVEVTRHLLEQGSCVNAQTRSGHVTPLHVRMYGRCYDNVRSLMNLITELVRTRAAYCGHERIVRMLLEHGAKPDLVDGDGRNALHKAAEKPDVGIVKLLIKSDNSLRNVKDNRSLHPFDFLRDRADTQEIADLLKPD